MQTLNLIWHYYSINLASDSSGQVNDLNKKMYRRKREMVAFVANDHTKDFIVTYKKRQKVHY